jgi:hypothetical protein
VQRQLNELEEIELRLSFTNLNHSTRTTKASADALPAPVDPAVQKQAQQAFDARQRGKRLLEASKARTSVPIVRVQ